MNMLDMTLMGWLGRKTSTQTNLISYAQNTAFLIEKLKLFLSEKHHTDELLRRSILWLC